MGYEDLTNRIEKDFWRFLQNQGHEVKRECKELRKQGYTKKQILDIFSPFYREKKVRWDTNNFCEVIK